MEEKADEEEKIVQIGPKSRHSKSYLSWPVLAALDSISFQKRSLGFHYRSVQLPAIPPGNGAKSRVPLRHYPEGSDRDCF